MEIGVWGDSITYGAGDSEALGWVGRLRKQFYKDDHGVYNRGVGGDSTEELLERFNVEVDSIEPDIIIFAVGTNDSKYPDNGTEYRVSPDIFQKNVKELVIKAKSKAKRVVLIGLTEVNERGIDSTSVFTNENLRKYDSILQEVAKEGDVEFISMQGVIDTSSDLVDGLHPNAGGYEKMFRQIQVAFSV